MAKMTSAQAAKQLKQLNEQHSALLEMEQKTSVFTAAIQENIEDARPEYSYEDVQRNLYEIERKIIKLKHALNLFNSTYLIPDYDMTIDQMLVYIPQLTARKKKFERMRSRLPKERISNGFTRSASFVEYIHCNYDVKQAEADYLKAAKELAAAQMALDKVNATITFETDD